MNRWLFAYEKFMEDLAFLEYKRTRGDIDQARYPEVNYTSYCTLKKGQTYAPF